MDQKEKKSLKELYDKLSYAGQTSSDKITDFIGSWAFIFLFIFFVVIWIGINIKALYGGFDPYPFILLNLTLSCLAAIQAPLIMMSQNRQIDRDRERTELDYMVNRRAEKEIADIQEDLDELKSLVRKETVERRKKDRDS
jgi:uncharacterized membrane protein